MLTTIKKEVKLNASATFDGVIAEYYQATINSEDPNDLKYTTSMGDKTSYKNNRDACKEDRSAFEEYMYATQAQMLKELETTQE